MSKRSYCMCRTPKTIELNTTAAMGPARLGDPSVQETAKQDLLSDRTHGDNCEDQKGQRRMSVEFDHDIGHERPPETVREHIAADKQHNRAREGDSDCSRRRPRQREVIAQPPTTQFDRHRNQADDEERADERRSCQQVAVGKDSITARRGVGRTFEWHNALDERRRGGHRQHADHSPADCRPLADGRGGAADFWSPLPSPFEVKLGGSPIEPASASDDEASSSLAMAHSPDWLPAILSRSLSCPRGQADHTLL